MMCAVDSCRIPYMQKPAVDTAKSLVSLSKAVSKPDRDFGITPIQGHIISLSAPINVIL